MIVLPYTPLGKALSLFISNKRGTVSYKSLNFTCKNICTSGIDLSWYYVFSYLEYENMNCGRQMWQSKQNLLWCTYSVLWRNLSTFNCNLQLYLTSRNGRISLNISFILKLNIHFIILYFTVQLGSLNTNYTNKNKY